jgi:hypothetical protein
VVVYLAEQLGIADPQRVKSYTQRKQTRYDHCNLAPARNAAE